LWFFGRPFVKRFALHCQTVVCPVLPVCHVCDVCVLWPNGWMDQGETWHTGRSRPWPHCVRWGVGDPAPLPKGHSPQFSAHICCGQMAGWIKMPLGREVGLDPSEIVLDTTQLLLPKRGGRAPPQFLAHFCCGQTTGWIKMTLGALEVGLSPGYIVLDGDLTPPPKKRHSPQFSSCVYCG